MTQLARVGGALGLNAYEVAFDQALLEPLRAVYRRLDLEPLMHVGEVSRGKARSGELAFHVVPYGDSMGWVSSDDRSTHGVFRSYFDALGLDASVRTLVDCRRRVEMYSGFFVVADRFPAPSWHVDYRPGANAYTLLTPLFALDPGHGHLLIRDDARERVVEYRYEVGKAILVGDHLSHTTKPFDYTGTRRVLVSLTFGTDRLKYWPRLAPTVATQSDFLVLPCGHERGAVGWRRAAHVLCRVRARVERAVTWP